MGRSNLRAAGRTQPITSAITHAGGPLTLTCRAFSISGVGTIVQNASLLATPLGAVHPP